jgi:hypothetical protein
MGVGGGLYSTHIHSFLYIQMHRGNSPEDWTQIVVPEYRSFSIITQPFSPLVFFVVVKMSVNFVFFDHRFLIFSLIVKLLLLLLLLLLLCVCVCVLLFF